MKKAGGFVHGTAGGAKKLKGMGGKTLVHTPSNAKALGGGKSGK